MKSLLTVTAIVVGSMLAGCVASPSPEDVAAVQNGKEQCERIQTSSVARARCKIAIAKAHIRPYAGNSMDLYNVWEAEQIALAEKVDKGQMTQANADLQMAQAVSQMASEKQQRNTNATVAWAAWKSAQPQIRTCQTTGFSYNSTTMCY